MSRKLVAGVAGALLVIAAQALAYWFVLPLSLGPRVILQPWLMQRGFLLYDQIADEHAPLLALLVTLLQPLAPDGVLLAKIALIALLSLTTALTFWAAYRRGGVWAALLALLFFALWSPSFEFTKLWHESLLAPLYILLLVWHLRSSVKGIPPSVAVTGLLLGVALLAKQHAIIAVIGIVLWTACAHWQARRPASVLAREMLVLAGAAFIPIAAFAVYRVATGGKLSSAFFWTVSFAWQSNYAELGWLSPRISDLAALLPAFLLPLLACLMLCLPIARTSRWREPPRSLAFVLLLTAAATVYPRFAPFHLQAVLPLLAWFSGVMLAQLTDELRKGSTARAGRWAPAIAIPFVALWLVCAGRSYPAWPAGGSRPAIAEFSNLVPLARALKLQIGPSDTFYVLPDDEATSNLYYLLQREPPRFWVPTSYPWFMNELLRAAALAALQQAAPDWVVYYPDRWGIQVHGRELVDYVQNHYVLVTVLSWPEGPVLLLHRESTNADRQPQGLPAHEN